MKKYNHYILPMLIAFSFFIGSSFSIPKAVNTSLTTSSVKTSLSQHFNVPDAEIEYYHSHISNGFHSQQGLQKIPGHFSYHEKAIVIAQVTISLNSFTLVELFDNNHLCHNYPSHNFW